MVPAAPVWAHNALRESTPAQGGRLASAPERVELVFAERLDATFTTVAVTAEGGAPVTAGKPTVTGVRATQPLAGGLAAGTYTVAYRVVSVDGHPVQGSYDFTVTAAPTGTASSSPSSAPTGDAPSAAAAPSLAAADGRGGGVSLAVVGALVAAVLAGGVLVLRRVRAGRR
ncbi:copper resistance CopC family protein [Micromonospora sp. B11E3]|uniref:copper resistance CopC family protein n=1 Tax=Micromonospora sp. B11E3 TaxID=3153562 RepID=UPI00325D80CF